MSGNLHLLTAIGLAATAAACLAVFLAAQLHAISTQRGSDQPAAAPAKQKKQILSATLGALLGALIAHAGGAFAMLAAAIICGLAGWFTPAHFAKLSRGKSSRLREQQIPAALDLLANGMKAGMSFHQAWVFATRQTSEPLGDEMAATLNEINLGRPMEDALNHLRQRLNCEDMDLTVSAIHLTLQTGGDLPQGLVTIARTIRDRAIMRSKIDALTAQGRLQAILVAAIPVVMVFITYSVDPVRTSLLWTTAYGWMLMAVLAVMDLLGFFTIQWICKIKI